MKTTKELSCLLTLLIFGMLFFPTTSGSQTTKYKYPAAKGTKHAVLVHGSFHGAWCWYKVSTLLQSRGFTVATLDLTSQGIDKTIADNVTSIEQFVQPVVDYLNNVTGKVVLLGHSLGGVSVSYLMEKFGPEKITKAMFLASIMPKNNQSFFEASIVGTKTIPPESQPLIFANGPSNPPTSIGINVAFARQLFYRQSPEEDVTLAKTLLVPQPYAVVVEYLHLTSQRYGKIPRYYIVTGKDDLIEVSLQEAIIAMNPPAGVFRLNNSDHSAFFSEPLKLTNIIEHVDLL
ncbi:hypothetical protein Mapa_013533 [Marchantia paleacea]|nr:hypothetical protein Mapa_013533 [Marchantia paleacea]